MIATTKLALGSTALFASVPLAYGTHWYTSIPKDVSDKLSKEGLQLLDLETSITSSGDSSNSESYKRWEKLIGENADDSDAKAFAGWTGSEQKHEKIEKMRQKCGEAIKVLYESNDFESNLEKSRKFCTKEKNA